MEKERRLAGGGLALIGVLLVAANLRPSITSVGPVIGDIEATTGISTAEASLLVSLPVVCFAITSPIAPRLAGRFRMRTLLAVSLLALAAGIVLRSVPVDAFLWVGSVLIGAPIGLMNVLLPALVKRDFPDRIGRVTGLYAGVMTGVAALASGIAVPIAGEEQEGWRLAIGVWAGLALIGAAFLLFLVRSHPNVHVHEHREHLPTGGFFWRSPLAWQATGFMSASCAGFYAFIAWWPSITQEDGFSDSAAGLQLFALQGVAVVSSLAGASLIQRGVSQPAIGVGVGLLNVVALAGMLLLPDLAFAWAVLAGVAAGAMMVFALSLFGLRTRDGDDAASLSGMGQTVGYAIGAVFPFLLGALEDVTGSWTVPLLVLLGVAVVQAGFGRLAGRDRYVTRGGDVAG
ncbi:MAG: MFS transporter [Thermoleophilia bacterium]